MPQWIWQQSQWPRFTWDEKALQPLLEKVDPAQCELVGFSRTIDREQDLSSQMDSLVRNAVRSFQIEGERLDAASVRSSLAHRLGLPRAGLPRGTARTDGVVEMLLDATRNFDQPLNAKRLQHWHHCLFPAPEHGLSPIRVGRWRGEATMRVVSGVIGREKIHFEAPPLEILDKELTLFLTWFDESGRDGNFNGWIRAGLAHLWFVTLHPFDDGNGRIARAVTDLALARAEARSIRLYAMSATIVKERRSYYKILEKTQRGKLDITRWLQWFLKVLQRSMEEAKEKIEAVLQKSRFWRKHAQTPLNKRQYKALNLLLDAEPEGFEGGINARKYMSLNRVSKATATRDLTDLVDKGCLKRRPGSGRATSYDILWPVWNLEPHPNLETYPVRGRSS